MIRAYKYRIYPTESQKAEFAKSFGCRRYICNYFVREHERAWKEEGKTIYEFDMTRLAQAHKQEKPWLADVSSSLFYWAAIGIVHGYDYFFQKINTRPPHERKKGDRPYQSFTVSGGNLNISFRRNLVFLPKIGAVRAKIHRRFYGDIKHATIRQTATGKYFVSLCVETRDSDAPMRPFTISCTVGIDVGVRHFVTLSNGTHIEMPDMSRTIRRRAFLQRRLRAQKEGSKGYEKTKLQIARLNEHITNSRLDLHHKTASDICNRYSTVCMETYNAEEMRVAVGEKKKAKDNGFNRQLNHVGLGQFASIMEAKARRTGANLVRIDRWEPSTKRCHVCGSVNKEIDLGVTEWTCPVCGTHHDRDVNAAINIRDKGIETILPLAEREVKPAKAAPKSGERTGKVTANDDDRPASQIDVGTAPPRLANKLANYVKQKAMNPANIQQSIQILRMARVKEESMFGVKEFFAEVKPIVKLKDLLYECRIRFSRYDYVYSLKGSAEYNKLMQAINVTLPDMLEDYETKEKGRTNRYAAMRKIEQEAAEKRKQMLMAEDVTSMAFFLSSSTVARLVGSSPSLINNWATNGVFKVPIPRQLGTLQRIVDAYLHIAKQLRELRYKGKDVVDMKLFKSDLCKLVKLNKVCLEIGMIKSDEQYLYRISQTPMMNCLMDFLNNKLPDMIETECKEIQANIDSVNKEIEEAGIMEEQFDLTTEVTVNPDYDPETAQKVAHDIAKYEAMKKYFLSDDENEV